MSEQADPPKEKPRSITIKFPDNNPENEKEIPRETKQSHICIFDDCKKGKRGGSIIVERINHFLRNSPTALQQKNEQIV